MQPMSLCILVKVMEGKRVASLDNDDNDDDDDYDDDDDTDDDDDGDEEDDDNVQDVVWGVAGRGR